VTTCPIDQRNVEKAEGTVAGAVGKDLEAEKAERICPGGAKLAMKVKSIAPKRPEQRDNKEHSHMSTLLILKATAGDLSGQEFALTAPAHCILGRSRSCTLRLPGDATVSRQHCLIEVEEDGVYAQDLGSLNGTLVNGEKIGQRERNRNVDATMMQPARQPLNNGDELRICNNVFQVELTNGLIARPPAQPAVKQGSGEWTLALCG
jgi:hypothetical protein